jgi:hypothetical protein
MSDQPETETPMQRALRLRKAALAAQPTPPGRGKVPRAQASSVPSGASKPWMKR